MELEKLKTVASTITVILEEEGIMSLDELRDMANLPGSLTSAVNSKFTALFFSQVDIEYLDITAFAGYSPEIWMRDSLLKVHPIPPCMMTAVKCQSVVRIRTTPGIRSQNSRSGRNGDL